VASEQPIKQDSGFNGIIGQEVPVRVLSQLSESGKLPGTLLFTGPGGTGKLATALAFARRLHCSEGFPGNCMCDSCRAIRAGNHPDVMVISRDKLIGVDEIRELIALAGLRSGPGQERVIIIDRAENITPSAANAALKTLEEPGNHVRFILITDILSSLLPTVRSRSYILRFTLLSPESMAEFAQSIGDDTGSGDTAKAIAFASGRPGWYLRWRLSENYREVSAEIESWLSASHNHRPGISVENALEWKATFWEIADKLSTAEKKANLPRGGDAGDIARFMASPGENRLSPINWRADDSVSKETRWGQGRKALLLADLMMRVMSRNLGPRTTNAIYSLQDFMQKIRFNCSFDIAIERLYFRIAGN
jgi:hypothetical protein